MGFDPDGYVDVITSGEMTFEGLKARAAAPYSEIKGTRCAGVGVWMHWGGSGFRLIPCLFLWCMYVHTGCWSLGRAMTIGTTWGRWAAPSATVRGFPPPWVWGGMGGGERGGFECVYIHTCFVHGRVIPSFPFTFFLP
jgi:hypothetical protein